MKWTWTHHKLIALNLIYWKDIENYEMGVNALKIQLKREQMNIPYAFMLRTLTYDLVCKRPSITYIVEMLGKYQGNLGLDHWRAAKKFIWYL